MSVPALGPKTEIGKSIVRLNAVKHNLFTSVTCLDEESLAEISEIRNDLFDCLQPEGFHELVLADNIAALYWRLRKVMMLSALVLQPAKSEEQKDLLRTFLRQSNYGDSITKLANYEGRIRGWLKKDLEFLERLQSKRMQKPISIDVPMT